MPGNSFGHQFRITTFGESHGPAIGVVIDGCPAGLILDIEFVQLQLLRRRPGQSSLSTQRQEKDQFQIISGVFEGKTTGTPLCMMIPNEDTRPQDYTEIKSAYRPSHADYTYDAKYGFRDFRGGGRSSARETAARVAAGAIAQLLLRENGISVHAWVSQVGTLQSTIKVENVDLSQIESSIIRCPDPSIEPQMIALIQSAQLAGDTVGGSISCLINGCEAGLGEPVFQKLQAELGHAVLGINACKGFEIGSGFAGTAEFGTQQNDIFVSDDSGIHTSTNNSGGIQGGISNGMPIYFRAAFKPVATVMQVQNTVDKEGQAAILQAKGRHDPCVLPRAVPIVEAMAALVIADHLLAMRMNKL
ncbi:MAG: chorismate synthase [Saprospiraceae bacterium]